MSLIDCVRLNDTDRLSLLLGKGYHPDLSNWYGYTPLIIGAIHNRVDCVRTLLEEGANPNIRDKGGKTALMRAAQDGHIKIVHLLLDRGADPSIHTKEGKNACALATDRDIISILSGRSYSLYNIRSRSDRYMADTLTDMSIVCVKRSYRYTTYTTLLNMNWIIILIFVILIILAYLIGYTAGKKNVTIVEVIRNPRMIISTIYGR
jgi:hypothetical protein